MRQSRSLFQHPARGCGELAARRGDRFEDYTDAIRSLARDGRFPADLMRQLEPCPGFRKVVMHEYVALHLDRMVQAVHRLEAPRRFVAIVAAVEGERS